MKPTCCCHYDLFLRVYSINIAVVNSSSGTTKLTYEGIRDVILGEDIAEGM